MYERTSSNNFQAFKLLFLFTGSGIGTLAFGPVLQHILQRYGLVTSLRILSGVSVLLPLTSLTYKTFRSPLEDLFEIKKQPGPFFDLSVWQNKAFCVYTGAVALFMLGYFIPHVHLVSKLSHIPMSFSSPHPHFFQEILIINCCRTSEPQSSEQSTGPNPYWDKNFQFLPKMHLNFQPQCTFLPQCLAHNALRSQYHRYTLNATHKVF